MATEYKKTENGGKGRKRGKSGRKKTSDTKMKTEAEIERQGGKKKNDGKNSSVSLLWMRQ